jgi:hypothetical protein
MNALPGFDRYIQAPYADDDTSAGEKLDAMQADMVRHDTDPVVQLIVALADDLSEPVESINQVIVAAYAHYGKIQSKLSEWDIALSDAMWSDGPAKTHILELCRSGADDAELGRLIRMHARAAMADACIQVGEDVL